MAENYVQIPKREEDLLPSLLSKGAMPIISVLADYVRRSVSQVIAFIIRDVFSLDLRPSWLEMRFARRVTRIA